MKIEDLEALEQFDPQWQAKIQAELEKFHDQIDMEKQDKRAKNKDIQLSVLKKLQTYQKKSKQVMFMLKQTTRTLYHQNAYDQNYKK